MPIITTEKNIGEAYFGDKYKILCCPASHGGAPVLCIRPPVSLYKGRKFRFSAENFHLISHIFTIFGIPRDGLNHQCVCMLIMWWSNFSSRISSCWTNKRKIGPVKRKFGPKFDTELQKKRRGRPPASISKRKLMRNIFFALYNVLVVLQYYLYTLAWYINNWLITIKHQASV